KAPIVVLRDAEETLHLPIWIGILEASAIASELEGVRPQRPMTHDLLRSTIGSLGGEVVSVEITDLRDNTFYARIVVRAADGTVEIDARPSDAIALALRTRTTILVARQVLEQSSVTSEPGEAAGAEEEGGASGDELDLSNVSPDQWADILEKMAPDDFKYKM
ncbi:bifunctional nuclease family protein, partial [bacterium]|nr:bifunctional nuclease family protein [bacterium]